jgi:hypothetical protein
MREEATEAREKVYEEKGESKGDGEGTHAIGSLSPRRILSLSVIPGHDSTREAKVTKSPLDCYGIKKTG